MTDVGLEAEPEANTQAQRTALSDQRMFEVAIELVNERGTAKTTLKDIGEGRATAVVWRAISLALRTVCGWSYSRALMTSGRRTSPSIYPARLGSLRFKRPWAQQDIFGA